MTNSVEDYALALDVVQGPDARDPQSLPAAGLSYRETLGDLPKLRCVLAPTLFGASVDPAVAAVIAGAFGEIAAHLPVEIVDAKLDWPDPVDIFDALWVARGALYGGLKPKTWRGSTRASHAWWRGRRRSGWRTISARCRRGRPSIARSRRRSRPSTFS